MRAPLIAVIAAGALLVGAAPAAPPDFPVNYIKVEELKALLDKKTKVDLVDVRSWAEYQELHIKGARSMPLKIVRERAFEIQKAGPVVLY
jgi:rhodanese-related sulfurtransferase